MIKGIGIDIERIERFRKLPEDFLLSVFSKREIEYCRKAKFPHRHFAGKFCAKEAVIKAMGGGISAKEVEIINDSSGKARVYLKGKIKKNINCSISHEKQLAVAMAVFSK